MEKRLEPSERPAVGAAELVAVGPRLRENPGMLVCGAVDVRVEPKLRPVAGAGAEVVVREKGWAEAAGFPKPPKPVAGAVDAAGAPVKASTTMVMDPLRVFKHIVETHHKLNEALPSVSPVVGAAAPREREDKVVVPEKT